MPHHRNGCRECCYVGEDPNEARVASQFRNRSRKGITPPVPTEASTVTPKTPAGQRIDGDDNQMKYHGHTPEANAAE